MLRDHVEPGHELIIDMHALYLPPPTGSPIGGWDPQGHVTDPYELPWLRWPGCAASSFCVDRFSFMEFILNRSGTALAINAGIAHGLPQESGGAPMPGTLISNRDLFDGVRFMNDQLQAERVLFAPAIMPNDRLELQLEHMDTWAGVSGGTGTAVAVVPGAVSAWLLDTGWPLPDDVRLPMDGYFLDDPEGVAVIEHGVALGVPVFLVRKGMPQGWHEPVHTSPRDVGPAARAHPDARFVILQSAFEHGFETGASSMPDLEDRDADVGWGPGVGMWPEGPYDALDPAVQADYPLDRGVNSLITSLRAAGIGPGDNVYASLDGVWAMLLERPTEAAHVLGKLLVHLGEDNILWGTQSTLAGDPTVLLDAFRAFQIPPELRARYGYPALTPERRAKILGLNAARLLCIDPAQWLDAAN